MSNHRIVTFGGCHSEYEHLNDFDMFDLSKFVESGGHARTVLCVRLNAGQVYSGPSSRWGHSACVYKDKIYVLGGRNSIDISDLHCYDLASKSWS